MMWNPPWALPAVLPLGLLPAREAQLLWLLVHLIVIGFCADRLWLMLGVNPARRWVGWAVAFAFMPTAFALSTGQISPFLLLGAVLFLECERRGWPYLAGAATVLVAIKPHLAYRLWVGIAVDAPTRGRWRVLVGGAVAGLACAVLPMAFNPDVWLQYAEALDKRPPAQWLMPTIGSLLRLAFGPEHFRLQFVPVIVGLVWFAWHRWKQRDDWNWTAELPLVLLVSFVTAPYGSWPFVMVLLLPAVFVMVAKRPTPPAPLPEGKGEQDTRSLALASRLNSCPSSPFPSGRGAGGVGSALGLVAVNVGCLVMNLCQTGSFPFLWVSPAVLVLYALHMRNAHRCKSQGAYAPRSGTAAAVPV